MNTVIKFALRARVFQPSNAGVVAPLLLLGFLGACAANDPQPTPLDTGSDAADAADAGEVSVDADTSDTTDTSVEDTCAIVCNDVITCEAAPSSCRENDDAYYDTCLASCADDPAMFANWAADDCAVAASTLAFMAGAGDLCLPEACERPATDYVPDAEDSWPACVSDGGTWARIEENVSTIGRIGSYETVAELLWRQQATPDGEAFIAARTAYSTDEGLESRVLRREDEHYPVAVNADGDPASCRDEGIPALNPDRCVGPARISPVLLEAFQQGIAGTDPAAQAAAIEAALLWFLHLSTFKEARTCAATSRDCDSAWAYYGGGEERDGGLGLAASIRSVSLLAHNRIYDGLLGVRCWRDLESEPTATNLALRDQAIAQFDSAQHFGLARVIADRVLSGETTPAVDQYFAQVLYNAIEREAAARDLELAEAIEARLSEAALDSADQRLLVSDLITLFPCP